MRLWLVRHGQTQANTQHLFCGRKESPLTQEGTAQARWVSQQLQHVPFDLVMVSERERAQHTANLITCERHPDAIVSALLNEMDFGDWEMRHHSQLINEDPRYQDWCSDWQHAVPPGGEGFPAFTARIANLAEMLRATPGENVLLVTHQGVISLLIAHLLNMPPAAMWSFAVEQGAWSRIDLHGEQTTLRYLNNQGGSLPAH